ncbi:RNA polymerase sigma factor [Enterococcus sp. AD013-P3]|uniref:RNA polymerase sigma factor n=1 Tax=Enterococcus sp. AD013-P3 TaxID=3411036 RepID=UPI003B930EC1
MDIGQYEQQLITIAKELIAYLIKAGASKEDAQDTSQEAFVKLLETELVLSPDKLRAWMYRVAITRYYNLYKRKKRYLELIPEIISKSQWSDIILPDSGLITALGKLELEESLLILMRYEQELSVRQISVILEISESAVKTRLFRIRGKLKQFIEEE